MKCVILFAIAVFFIFAKSGQGRIEIDIYKTKPNILAKIKKYNGKKTLTDTWKNDSAVLYKFLNGEYYGLIGVGTPSKTFKVIFDTTWADTWLPSAHCDWTEIACKIHNQYDSSSSSSYSPNGRFVAMSSKELTLQGILSADDFHLAHVKVLNQTFLEATHMSFSPFWQYRADGVVGLAYQEQSGWPDAVPFFYSMMEQKVIDKNIFTFYMNRDDTTDKAGKVIFGATQRSNVKNETLTDLKVVEKKFWMVMIDGIFAQINKTQTPLSDKCKAIFDSSSNAIVGPADTIKRLNWMLRAQYVPILNRYTVSCRQYAKFPDVYFVFNGNNFTIQSKYYVHHMVLGNIEMCLSPFVPSDDQDYWILGGAFMMEFYTEFDMDNDVVRIGQTVF